jgi:hypothetical protein
VIGNRTELSWICAEGTAAGVMFNVGLGEGVDQTSLGGAAGTIDIDGSQFFLGQFKSSRIDGLHAEAIVSSTVFDQSGKPGSAIEVDISWACDPTSGIPNA